MAEDFVREGKDGVLLTLRVSAPPTDGRANAGLKGFLAGIFDLDPSRLEVVRGASGRDKVVFVRGAWEADIRNRIALNL